MTQRRQLPRTDCDVLRERVSTLEAALSRIAHEAEPTFDRPEMSFVTIHRIAFVARATLLGS